MADIGEFGTIEQETMAIADAVGNEQANDGTISGAIDLVREALASESGTERSETVAEAIHRLAPYIGAGGGGAELGELVTISGSGGDGVTVYLSLEPFDISGESYDDIESSARGQSCASVTSDPELEQTYCEAAGGLYVCIIAVVDNAYDPSECTVYKGDETLADGYEIRKLLMLENSYAAILTMRIPSDASEIFIEFVPDTEGNS